MKKNLFILTILLFAKLLFAYDFTCIVDSEAVIRPRKNDIYVEKTDRLANQEIVVSTDEVIDNCLLIKDSNYYIKPDNLSLKNSTYLNKLIKNKKWLLKPCVDALYNSNPSLIYKYSGNVKDYIIKNQNPMDFPEHTWDEYVGPTILKQGDGLYHYIYTINKVNWSVTSFDFLIIDMTESNLTIFTTFIYNPYNFDIISNDFKENEIYKFKYELDGDYLNLYLDDELFISFVNADESLIQQYTEFITGRDYLLANAKWPKHADGSCDYNDSVPNYYGTVVESYEDDPEYVAESLVLAENSFNNNLEINKKYQIFKKTELREESNDWSNILCELPKNANIKILEINIKDVIHNVLGNWVKVEILDTELKGKTGYVFSSYLKEIEQNQTEATNTKTINYLPFLIAGICIIVIILILLYRKKK